MNHALSIMIHCHRASEIKYQQMRDCVLSELQKENLVTYERYNHKIQPIYQGEFNGVIYHIPVHHEVKKTDAWDVVPTILLPGMKTYSQNLEMVTVDEAAKKLNVTQERVMQFLKEGRLKFDPRIKHVIKIYKLDVRRLNQELIKERAISDLI